MDHCLQSLWAPSPLLQQWREWEKLIGYQSRKICLLRQTSLRTPRLDHKIYLLSGNSFDPKEVKDILFNIIKKCEGLQIVVDAVISDMGPGNQGIWRLCGVHASRSVPAAVSCKHPCAGDTDRQLFFLADAPHLLKNIRGHLVKGQEIVLPRDVVEKHGLPSNRVLYACSS